MKVAELISLESRFMDTESLKNNLRESQWF